MKTTTKSVLSIDIETYSEADLMKVGVYRYVDDPSFEVLLFAYSVDNGPTFLVDFTQGDKLPEEIKSALTDPNIIKAAYNANFERVALSKHIGENMKPEQWRCTMVRAATLGLPGSLAAVGEVLGLDEDKAKLKSGKALITFFSKPCRPTNRNNQRTRNLPEHDPEKWELYRQYCAQDVDAEKEIYRLLERYPDTLKTEQELWSLDQTINDRGVRIDQQLVTNILHYNETHQEELIERAQEITGVDNPKSVKQSKEWLETKGIEAESLNKAAVKELLNETENKKVKEFLKIKQQLGKTSVSKFEAMDRAVCSDGKIRGMLQFYGANRTGRWAGRIVQLQNLPSNKMNDLDLARGIIKEGDMELLEMLYAAPSDVFSQLVRTALVAKPDHTFIVADYSAIEARVIAWLAGEEWRMEVFRGHGKIYEASAAQMFGIPLESITRDSPERAKGKVAELALGYQGGPGALKAMGAEAMGLTDAEMKRLVNQWRNSNANIVKFWYDTDRQVKSAITNQGQIIKGNRGLEFQMLFDTLFIKLPSGRKLAYKNAGLREGKYGMEAVYDGVNQETKKWQTVNSYGGKFVENITQAVARDILGHAMLRLDKLGYPISFHVHDEVVIEVPIESKDSTMAAIVNIMSEDIEWAKGLKVTADAYDTEYYMKD